MSTLVLIPTYNERENIEDVVRRVRAAAPQVDVLVLDDASPDGTGEVADALAAADPQVTVLHRTGKEGLGRAYIAGFRWGLEHGYDVLVEMDADGSHLPEQLPSLLEPLTDGPDAGVLAGAGNGAADGAAGGAGGGVDLVIGSRWVPGGSIVNWAPHRKALSAGGNTYIRFLLGMGVRDATAGFRAYRADTLRAVGLDDVASQGYCFQTDLTWRVAQAGGRIVEVPITFVERERGSSKMSRDIVVESMRNITEWGVRHRLAQARAAAAARREGRWHSL